MARKNGARSRSSREASRDAPGPPRLKRPSEPQPTTSVTVYTADGPVRLFRRGPYGWIAADLRHPWLKGRPTLRDPKAPHWPAHGDKTQDFEVAQAWLLGAYVPAVREEKQRNQKALGPVPKRLGDAITDYLRYRKYGGAAQPGAPMSRVAQNTVERDLVAANHLRRYAREDSATGRRGDDLRTHQLSAEFMGRLFTTLLEEEYEVSTVLSMRSSLSAFLRWLGHGRENGAAVCQLPRPDEKPEVHTWTDDELEAIREAARELDGRHTDFTQHLRAVDWALIGGGRRNELFGSDYRLLRPSDDEYQFRYQVHVHLPKLVNLKGRMGRTALLLPAGGGWMDRIDPNGSGLVLAAPDGSLIRTREATEIGGRILDQAGLHRPGVGWHSFRHTYARDYLLDGGTLEGLQESLGHSSIQITQFTYKHMQGSAAAQRDRRQMLRFRDRPIRLVG